jgi:hypothetical protein
MDAHVGGLGPRPLSNEFDIQATRGSDTASTEAPSLARLPSGESPKVNESTAGRIGKFFLKALGTVLGTVGLLAAAAVMLFGAALCCTGLGIIIGLPIMMIGQMLGEISLKFLNETLGTNKNILSTKLT